MSENYEYSEELFVLFALGCVLLWLWVIDFLHILQGYISLATATINKTHENIMTSSNENFAALLALYDGNPSVSDAEIWIFFYLRLNKLLSKQSRSRWSETPSRSLWHHRDEIWINRSQVTIKIWGHNHSKTIDNTVCAYFVEYIANAVAHVRYVFRWWQLLGHVILHHRACHPGGH